MRQRVRESKKEGDIRGKWAREIDKMRKINRERESEKQSWIERGGEAPALFLSV